MKSLIRNDHILLLLKKTKKRKSCNAEVNVIIFCCECEETGGEETV